MSDKLDSNKIEEWKKDAEESLDKWDGNYDEDYEIQCLANRLITALADLARRDERIAELEAIIDKLKDDVDPADYHPIGRMWPNVSVYELKK